MACSEKPSTGPWAPLLTLSQVHSSVSLNSSGQPAPHRLLPEEDKAHAGHRDGTLSKIQWMLPGYSQAALGPH